MHALLTPSSKLTLPGILPRKVPREDMSCLIDMMFKATIARYYPKGSREKCESIFCDGNNASLPSIWQPRVQFSANEQLLSFTRSSFRICNDPKLWKSRMKALSSPNAFVQSRIPIFRARPVFVIDFQSSGMAGQIGARKPWIRPLQLLLEGFFLCHCSHRDTDSSENTVC